MTTMDVPLPEQRRAVPIWLLVMITISGTLAMHMFVPALPYAAHHFSTDMATMQMTISLYIIGLAVGQLFYGPLSDAFGRRPLVMIGLAVYTVAGLAAAFAGNVHQLIAARLLQALGGCAGLVLGRAIVRDTAKSDKAVRQLALMNLMTMVGPGLAPVIGGAVSAAFGWRGIFALLTMLGATALVMTWRLLPETGRPTGRFSPAILVNDYKSLLRSPLFIGFAFGGSCATTSMYGFIATAPVILTVQLHRPLHELGYYLALLIFGMSIGNALTSRLVGRISIHRLLLSGNLLSVLSALSFLFTAISAHLTLAGTMGLMFFFTMGAGISSPAALTKAVSVNPKLVGSAAGLYGFTQMVVGATCTSIGGLGSNHALTVATVLATAAVLGQVSFWIALAQERAAAARAGRAIRHEQSGQILRG
jgi:DHA1 family bicyclomycin/chloramphenicol resistance-like MFS transporter